MLGLYGENGEENGNYYNGLYRDSDRAEKVHVSYSLNSSYPP